MGSAAARGTSAAAKRILELRAFLGEPGSTVRSRKKSGGRGANVLGFETRVFDGNAFILQKVDESLGFLIPAVAGGSVGKCPLDALENHVAPFEMMNAVILPFADWMLAGGNRRGVMPGRHGYLVAAHHDLLRKAAADVFRQLAFNGVLLGERGCRGQRRKTAIGIHPVDEMAMNSFSVVPRHGLGQFVDGSGKFIEFIQIGVNHPIVGATSVLFQTIADLRLAVIVPAGEEVNPGGLALDQRINLIETFFHAFAQNAKNEFVEAKPQVVIQPMRQEIDRTISEDSSGEKTHEMQFSHR